MNAALIARTHCVACGGSDLHSIVTVEDYPVFQGCVTFAPGDGETAPMRWSGCADCGAAQIAALPPLEQIYQAGHATGLGAAWARHHTAFAAFIARYACGAIVDIGGGSGTLAVAYRKGGGMADWTILEPNALSTPDLPEDVAVVDGFLEADALARIGAGSVVLCHMLEHVADLRTALSVLADTLPQDGRILLAWPELEHWVAKGLAGALNFEHGLYVSVPRLEALFAEFGWQVVAEEYWAENDTRFIALGRAAPRADAFAADPAQTHDAVAGYFARFRAQAGDFAAQLADHRGEAFLMPASIYAQTLLAAGLPQTRFTALLDNAPAKQGRRLYGTALPVVAPADALAGAARPLVLLNGGAHDREIAASLRELRADIAIIGPGFAVCDVGPA